MFVTMVMFQPFVWIMEMEKKSVDCGIGELLEMRLQRHFKKHSNKFVICLLRSIRVLLVDLNKEAELI